MKKIISVFAISIFLCNLVFSADLSKKCMALIDKGIDYIKKNGTEKAYSEFSSPKGQFVEGELYLFVLDKTGLTLAHGGNAALVGKNNYDLKDVDGIYFIRELIKIAIAKGNGFFEYKWTNPATKKVQKKRSYIKVIPDVPDTYIFSGYYM
jgi:cytochrome c